MGELNPGMGEQIMQFVSYARDPELRSYEVAVTLLDTLEPDVRARLLRYLNDRYGVD